MNKRITFNCGPLTAFIACSWFQLTVVLGCICALWLMGYHAGQRSVPTDASKLMYVNWPAYPNCETQVFSNSVYVGTIMPGESKIVMLTNAP